MAWATHSTLANVLFDLEEWSDAEREFRIAAEMEPTDWVAAYNAGLSSENQRFSATAVEWYTKALSRNPATDQRYKVEQGLKRVRGY